MTTKGNKLESKLKEYTLKAALIPFSYARPKKYNLYTNKGPLVASNFVLSLMVSFGALVYLVNTISTGSFNPARWSEIGDKQRMQNQTQQQIKQQNTYRNQFYELDKSQDGLIDSTEFIYRK